MAKRIRGSNAEYHLSMEQVRRIIAACPSARDAVLVGILAFTGIRRAEVAALTVNDILRDDRLLIIRKGKGNKQRVVPLPRELLQSIRDLIVGRTSGTIVRSRAGRPLGVRQINRIVARAGSLAKVDNPNPRYRNITCHLFRHTFARLWKLHNGSMESLSKLLGHETQATTMDLYGKESIHDMRRNYEEFIRKITK